MATVMDQTLVRAPRARGVDVLTALEAGMVERDDPDHLAYATIQGAFSARSTSATSTGSTATTWREARATLGSC